jgi:tetratricopeptide (TPR) repeat protein
MDKNSNKNRSLLICLALAFAAAAVFYQVRAYDFVHYDDHIYVYENPDIQAGITLKTIKWAFTTGYAANWHPLTWLSHTLDWQLFGSNAGGHHLTNLIFHIANTLLLFVVLKQMTGALWQSAFVAALFALHPLHVESIAWVSERKDVLSTFFWLLTMWAYVRFVSHPKIIKTYPKTSKNAIYGLENTNNEGFGMACSYLLVVVFLALGLMSKPMLVTLPFILLLLDYWPLERFPAKHSLSYLLIEKIPLFAIVIASCIVTFIVQRKGGAMSPSENFGLLVRLANAFISYLQYIMKMFWPSRLAFFCPHPGENVSFFYAVISAVLLLAVTILILRFAKNHRYLATGWFWYLGTLVPVIGLVQVGNQALADRYSYITLTGLFIIIAWGLPDLLGKWPHRKIMLWTSSLIVLSVLAVCAYFQQRYWKDTITLCRHALKINDNNYVARFCMARYLVIQDRFDEGAVECQKYLQIKPNDPDALNIFGIALTRQGKYEQAIKCFTKALQIKPGYAAVYDNIGRIMFFQGKYDEAAVYLTEALRFDPAFASTHYRLGQVLVQKGKINEAIPHFEEALRLKPDWVEPMNDLAWILAASNKSAIRNPYRAVELAQRACELTGGKNPGLLDVLAVSYAATGEFDKAVEIAEKALELCQSPEQKTLKEEIKNRLVLYKAGKPYIGAQ